MSIQTQFPEFVSRIENPDARTTVREKLTVLDVSSDWSIYMDELNGEQHLVIEGPTTPVQLEYLVDDPQVPLSHTFKFVDGASNTTYNYLGVHL